MKRSLAFCLAVLCSGAYADDLVAGKGRDTVRLTQAACPAEILALLPANAAGFMKLAITRIAGVEFRACWIVYGDSIALKYEDNDNGLVPLSDFTVEHGI